MPPELVDYDFDAHRPEGMTDLTLSHAYNIAWTAEQAGMTPAEYRVLPWEEQAELMAYFYVAGRIKAFYADQQQTLAERKQREYEAKAKR